METKIICRKCGNERFFSDYQKDKQNKTGIKYICKYCISEYIKNYAITHKEGITKRRKKYQIENCVEIQQYKKTYYLNNIKKSKTNSSQYYKNNTEKIKCKAKNWQLINKDRHLYLQKKSMAKSIETMDYWYIKRILILKGFSKEDITPELIEVQRLLTQTKRLCKTSQNSETV